MINNLILDVDNISKNYENNCVVDNIKFQAYKGDILGLLGANGAGKTTSMRMMSGYCKPDSGHIMINGLDLYSHHTYSNDIAKTNIGYLPEGVPLYEELRVISFLKFIADMRKIPKKNINNALDFVIDALSLKDVLCHPIDILSKGYKRRIGIAQAIIHDPDLLILDEPTDGLDPLQKAEMRKLINVLSKHKAIVISTHILEEVETICNKVIILNSGKIIYQNTADALCAYTAPVIQSHIENKMEHIFRSIINDNEEK